VAGEEAALEIEMRNAALITVLTTFLLANPASTLENIWNLLASAWGATTIESGCGLDPYGTCKPAPTIDSGCGLDPNGRPICQQGS
jgi:hypothetical protein